MNANKQILLSAGIVVAAVALVAFQVGGGAAPAQTPAQGHDHAAMLAKGGADAKPVSLDAEAQRRIGVTFATVERRELPVSIQSVGTVVYDETRLSTVSPKVDGWVEKLYVDFTGAPVRAGQPLMDVYSPALVSAQEELVLAAGLVAQAGEGRASQNALELLRSARRRLAYWDVSEEEIARIERTGEPTKTLTLRAPASGVVVEKNVVEGDRITPGMTVYRIADLSRVWIEAEVFEKDLALVREGQAAGVGFEAYPGASFTGRVTYVYPTVSVQSRTARVRIELPNAALALRPGMFAQIDLDVPPGPPTLVVPRSAVIATGERALVFVQDADGTLVPHEVRMGRTSGQLQELLLGVEEGERVVASAAFLVDAESNLGSMTSMPGMDMGAPGDDPTGGGVEGGMEGSETPDMPAMPGMDHSAHQGHAGHRGH